MEINKKLEETLEKQFPKGDKARGRAMVLVGVAQVELEISKNKLKYCEEYLDECC